MYKPSMTLQFKKDIPVTERNKSDFFLSRIDEAKMLALIEEYGKLTPIPFMSRVDTPKGEGFVVGYLDLFSYYKREGCLLLRDFCFPEYKVLLDRGTKDADEYGNTYRLCDFDKREVKFLKSYVDWLAERKLNAETYFENLKQSREVEKQKVMNKETTKINEAASLDKAQNKEITLEKFAEKILDKPLTPVEKEVIQIVAEKKEVVQEPPKPKFNLRR